MSVSVFEAIRSGSSFLKERGFEDALESSEQLLSHILSKPKWALYLNSDTTVSKEKETLFFDLLKKRSHHYPIQYLIGRVPFRYVDLNVKQGTFIPRPETELLVDVVLDRLRERGETAPKILDIGTGTGCLAISLVCEIRDAHAIATDRSKTSLKLASLNAAKNQVERRISFRHTSFWEGIAEVFDIVVSNPPYLSKKDLSELSPEVRFEPKGALDGGSDGLDCYRYIAQEISQILASGGLLALEVGVTQAKEVEKLLCQNGFGKIQTTKDFAGVKRIVSARLLVK